MGSIEVELSRGALPSAELRERLGISGPTLMRLVRERRDVVRFGRARATRYALRQTWPNLDTSRFPLFRITETGRPETAGHLCTLAARQTVRTPDGRLFEGLPVELSDGRPSGFLGRHFAAQHPDLRLPARLTDWSDHHVLLAISRRGEDVPSNLIVGDEAFSRWQALRPENYSRADYPQLAEATMAGHPPGSSAGGERPKFGVLNDGRHLLVKFAARAGDSVARRWCDLLVLESLALGVVSTRGTTSARTDIVETTSHCFLESERFDRVGVRGRVAVLSLAAAHDDPTENWARAGVRLREAGRLSDDDARRLCWLDAFGALIANSDRHQYNVLFFTSGGRLTLAPAFDQVSMQYAPSADGQVQSRVMPLPHQTADTLDVWDDAYSAACEFWLQAANDSRLSEDMRQVCRANLNALRNADSAPVVVKAM